MKPRPTIDHGRTPSHAISPILRACELPRLFHAVAALAAGLLLACCASQPESMPRYELPPGWEWQQIDGITDHLTAVKYLGAHPVDGSGCDCPVGAEFIQIAGTPPGSDADARTEIAQSYEEGRGACDSERQHQPDVGTCGLEHKEITIAGYPFHVYLGHGMNGPVSLFTFVKSGNVVHGSVTGRADAHLSELETVINTLTWQ